jgi:hypothetical protein
MLFWTLVIGAPLAVVAFAVWHSATTEPRWDHSVDTAGEAGAMDYEHAGRWVG